jgi:O-antigen/teichoic acid export membrane protein
VLARSLGVEDYGMYALALSAAAVFSGISLLGLDDAMVRYVAILRGRGDQVGLRGTLQLGLGVSTAVSVLLGAGLFLGARLCAEGLFGEPRLVLPLRLVAMVVPLLSVSNVLAGTARGLRRMDYVAYAENVVQSTVRLVLLGALALLGRLDLIMAVLVFGVSDLIASVTLIVLLHRQIPLGETLRLDARRDAAEVFEFALPLWLSGLLRQFRNNVESVLLGALSTVSAVGILAVIDRVTLVGHVFLLSILVAVKPILAQLHDRGDRRGLSQVYRAATRWTLTLNMPFFLITVLYPDAILSVFGETFIAGAAPLVLLAVAELVNAATGICGPMIDMTGHTRVKLANSVLWTVLTIAASALLIPRWGVLGAAVGALIAVSTVNFVCVAEVWILERFLPFDRTFWKPVGAGLGALASGLALSRWMPVGVDMTAALAQGALVVLMYLGLIAGMRLPTEDRLVVARMFRSVGGLVGRARLLWRPM